MKVKYIATSAAVLAVMLGSGCTSMNKKNFLTTKGSLASAPMTIVSRPTEFGMEVIGEGTGEASNERVLCFNTGPDKVSAKIPLLGNVTGDPLEAIACYRAVEALNGDAFYIVKAERSTENFIVVKRDKIKVKGKVLKIKDLGMISPDRLNNTSITIQTKEAAKQTSVFRKLFWFLPS